MNRTLTLVACASVALFAAMLAANAQEVKPVPAVLNFKMKALTGEEVDLAKYQGKVVLMVNTASKCGYTYQYKGLEEMYDKYKDKGLVILGFPANNFREQEPGSDKEIAEFCEQNYGVKFPMFSKISVLKGADQSPLFKYLTENAPQTGEVKWNFEKFLVNKEGKIVGRFLSKVEPVLTKTTDNALVNAVESELGK